MDQHSFIMAGLAAGTVCAAALGQTGSGATASGQTMAQSAGETKPADMGQDVKTGEPKSGEEADPRTKLDGWHGSAALNIWAPSLSGNVAARGASAHVNETFIQIVQQSDSVFGFNGRFELGKGIFTGYVDGTYMRVGMDDQPGPSGGIDVTTELTFVEFGLSVQVGHWLRDEPGTRPANSPGRYIDLDVYVGGRYTNVGMTLAAVGGGPSASENRSWVDPLIGLRTSIDLCENWKVTVNGDVGGFGCGGSQFAWQAQVLFDYRFDMWGADASFTFGYRALDENYAKQRAVGEFKWDMTLYGPIFGLTVRF
ncbi:MAG: hypothetical protein ACREJO_10600 [Phycisphaerales bacterium]